jgi:hypothetical protein
MVFARWMVIDFHIVDQLVRAEQSRMLPPTSSVPQNLLLYDRFPPHLPPPRHCRVCMPGSPPKGQPLDRFLQASLLHPMSNIAP